MEELTYAKTFNMINILRKSSVINDLTNHNIVTDPICDDPEFVRLELPMEHMETDLYGHKFYQVKLPEGWRWEKALVLDAVELQDQGGFTVYRYVFPSLTYSVSIS